MLAKRRGKEKLIIMMIMLCEKIGRGGEDRRAVGGWESWMNQPGWGSGESEIRTGGSYEM